MSRIRNLYHHTLFTLDDFMSCYTNKLIPNQKRKSKFFQYPFLAGHPFPLFTFWGKLSFKAMIIYLECPFFKLFFQLHICIILLVFAFLLSSFFPFLFPFYFPIFFLTELSRFFQIPIFIIKWNIKTPESFFEINIKFLIYKSSQDTLMQAQQSSEPSFRTVCSKWSFFLECYILTRNELQMIWKIVSNGKFYI